MNCNRFLLFILFIFPVFVIAQTVPPSSMNVPKDAKVEVSIADSKTGAFLSNEIIIFRSLANSREYQGMSDNSGKFTLQLPTGSKYEIFILGFKDSTSYNMLDIPALKGTQFYKNAFKVDIQFEAPKAFVLDNCTFETGKADLKPESYTVIDELADYLKRKTDEKIEVGGHTDNVGKAEANLKLSDARANAVRNYLLSRGIAADRIIAKGYGMTMPIAENDTDEGRALNRRTEVKVL